MNNTVMIRTHNNLITCIVVQTFHKVIYVMCEQYRTMAQEMGFQVAADVNEALEMALQEKGRNAHIAVIPDGVSVMVKKPEK